MKSAVYFLLTVEELQHGRHVVQQQATELGKMRVLHGGQYETNVGLSMGH